MIRSFLNVNGNKIEILQKGSHGSSIIILTGMGLSFDEWHDVTESLSKSNKVMMFHRPGLGESEIGDEIRHTQAVVNDLTEITKQLQLTEPIILVGHSYGGLCVQHFAKLYPERVKGIVLVDSTSVDLKKLDELHLPVLDEHEADETWVEKCLSYSKMNPSELKEVLNPKPHEKQKELPLYIQQRLINFQINPSMYKAMYLEIDHWKKDAELIKKLGRQIFDIPLIVIGRDKEHSIRLGTMEGLPEWELRKFEEKWQELITEQIKLTKNSTLVLAKDSSHAIHLDKPDIIIKAILEIDN